MKGKHGGKRANAGRKTKVAEEEVINQLKPYDEIALKKLIDGVKSGEFAYLKLFFEYRYTKPKQTIENTGEGSVFRVVFDE